MYYDMRKYNNRRGLWSLHNMWTRITIIHSDTIRGIQPAKNNLQIDIKDKNTIIITRISSKVEITLNFGALFSYDMLTSSFDNSDEYIYFIAEDVARSILSTAYGLRNDFLTFKKASVLFMPKTF